MQSFDEQKHRMNLICNIQSMQKMTGQKKGDFAELDRHPTIYLEHLMDEWVKVYNKQI